MKEGNDLSSLVATDPPGLRAPKIHPTYQILEDQARSLVQTLVILKRRRVVMSFQKVRVAIERETKHSFTRKTLGQVMTIFDAIQFRAVGVNWRKDNRKNAPWELYFTVTTAFTFDSFSASLSKYLMDKTIEQYSNYLRDKGMPIPPVFAYISMYFYRQDVEPIEAMEINPPPVEDNQTSLIESLERSILKDQDITVADEEIEVPTAYSNLRAYSTVLKERIRNEKITKIAEQKAKESQEIRQQEGMKLLIRDTFVRERRSAMDQDQLYKLLRQQTSLQCLNEDSFVEVLKKMSQQPNTQVIYDEEKRLVKTPRRPPSNLLHELIMNGAL